MKFLETMGKAPSARRLELMKRLPYYQNRSFVNLDFTPNMSEEFRLTKVVKEMLFPRDKLVKPSAPLPNTKINLHQLPQDTLVWFGHSSYLIRTGGFTILVDPVLSGRASPIPGAVKAFEGTDVYRVQDLPPIDVLLITHDHYDHLDHKTIKALRSKVGRVVCGLGVGEHLEFWGYPATSIQELVWHQRVQISDQFAITATPVRHFSGRGLKRNNTLFCSYVLSVGNNRIFVGGDSGYGSHLAEIGRRYGQFDFGLIECGQYNQMWKEIHALPHEWKDIVTDLGLKSVMPVHFGKFKLALHPWNEPVELFYKQMHEIGLPVFTPKIGEPIAFLQAPQTKVWWR